MLHPYTVLVHGGDVHPMSADVKKKDKNGVWKQ